MLSNRVILSKNGTLSDLSTELNDFTTGTSVINIVAAQDYLYLGSDFPFNHRFFNVSVANALASLISEIALWDGSVWQPAVEIVDETLSAGKSMAQSGVVSWVPDRFKSWVRSDTNSSQSIITGLTTVTIYDLYWARIKFSADLTGTTALKSVGFRFSNDEHLALEYPDLLRSDVLTNFESGKTDWLEQHQLAAIKIIEDLRHEKVVVSGNQILTHQQFQNAAVHKVAQIVFNAFGKAFEDNKKNAIAEYKSALKKAMYNIDTNEDGDLSVGERIQRQGFMIR